MAISAVDSPTSAQAGMGQGCPRHGEPWGGLPLHHPPGVLPAHAWRRKAHSVIGVSPPSHGTGHTQPHPTRGCPGHPGRERAPWMPHPIPASPSHWTPGDPPQLTAELKAEREADVPPKPSQPSKSSCRTSPSLIANVPQVGLELLGCT